MFFKETIKNYLARRQAKLDEIKREREFFTKYFVFGKAVFDTIEQLDTAGLFKKSVSNATCDIQGLVLVTSFDFDNFHVVVSEMYNTKWKYLLEYGPEYDWIYSVDMYYRGTSLTLAEKIYVWKAMKKKLFDKAGWLSDDLEVHEEIKKYIESSLN